MKKEETDHALEFLLAFNGRVHWLEQGYCIRFEIRRIEASPPRLADFFSEVRRILAERGISEEVVDVTDEGNEP
jgi:hypothetical protein